MAKSKSSFNWKTWVYPGIPSVLVTLLGVMYPDEAKALERVSEVEACGVLGTGREVDWLAGTA